MTTATPPSTSARLLPAPWRAAFLASAPQTFVVSTVQRHGNDKQHGKPAPSHFFPRARTCVLRGLWCHLPRNERNPAPLNPKGIWASDMPVFTTDARTGKVRELWESSDPIFSRPGRGPGSGSGSVLDAGWRPVEDVQAVVAAEPQGTSSAASPPSFVGGPVEAVFWSGSPAQTQWRVRGTAVVVGPDIDEEDDPGPPRMPRGAAIRREAKDLLLSRMRAPVDGDEDLGVLGVQAEGTVRVEHEEDEKGRAAAEEEEEQEEEERAKEEPSWSFSRELTAHFGNLSPLMRGTFRNPPPGTPMPRRDRDDDGRGRLGQRVENLHDAVARGNFRAVVIVPDELDQVDLSNPERARRWLWRRRGAVDGGDGGDEWEKVELWP